MKETKKEIAAKKSDSWRFWRDDNDTNKFVSQDTTPGHSLHATLLLESTPEAATIKPKSTNVEHDTTPCDRAATTTPSEIYSQVKTLKPNKSTLEICSERKSIRKACDTTPCDKIPSSIVVMKNAAREINSQVKTKKPNKSTLEDYPSITEVMHEAEKSTSSVFATTPCDRILTVVKNITPEKISLRVEEKMEQEKSTMNTCDTTPCVQVKKSMTGEEKSVEIRGLLEEILTCVTETSSTTTGTPKMSKQLQNNQADEKLPKLVFNTTPATNTTNTTPVPTFPAAPALPALPLPALKALPALPACTITLPAATTPEPRKKRKNLFYLVPNSTPRVEEQH